MDEARFTLSQVAAAAGLDVGTLRSWLQRGHFKLEGADKLAPVARSSHRLTLRRALHVGTAVELVRKGFDPASAFAAARAFSDESEPEKQTGDFLRDPGELFPPPAWTWLIAFAESKRGEVIRIEDEKGTPKSIPVLAFHDGWTGSWGGTAIFLNQVDRRIRTGLGNA